MSAETPFCAGAVCINHEKLTAIGATPERVSQVCVALGQCPNPLEVLRAMEADQEPVPAQQEVQ